tara:strand:+ start:153 stop:1100 length:948 start_codon:yes stop_codon:yes gene_type:complete
MKVLITTASFTDNEGVHKKRLDELQWELVINKGPLTESELIPLIKDIDGIICGDDEYTAKVLDLAKRSGVKGISKYGVGLDKIDLEHAKRIDMPIRNVLGVNQKTVAEHTIALIISFVKNIHKHYFHTSQGVWKRTTGTELNNKVLGILGLGRIGSEVAKIAQAFGMKVIAFDPFIDPKSSNETLSVDCLESVEELFEKSDIVSLHIPLTNDTKHLLNERLFSSHTKPGIIIVNTSRGELVDKTSLVQVLRSGKVRGYLTDVLDKEPMGEDEELYKLPNVLITPHVGSRTVENVEKQGLMAVNNLEEIFKLHNNG